ncbi:MAG: PSD1 domain-containing protein [Pirellulales bacterium]|nr:PSD1 domain-containing protein [Pirellulales bacterium]
MATTQGSENDPAPANDTPAFDGAVAALLRERCVECHNHRKRSGKLNLETPLGLALGGENGDAVVASDVDASLLWHRVADDEMPPEKPLSEDEKSLLRSWIADGAVGLPAEVDRRPGADHWAFHPPVRPVVPTVAAAERVRTPVDAFVFQALEDRGLTLAPEADRATLIRRVSFTLTGLPPSATEIAAFLADAAPDAYERMVERYLASPRYGERWGKLWLDAAGYADSNGYFNADTDRPLAYRYRDYVIRSFNDDKPFDRFLTEQIAGDELVGYAPGGDITPEMIEPLTATHFLRNAPDGTDSSDGNDDERRLDRFTVLEGTVQILGSSLLGLTLQCARCHDHKFEPVATAEYYSLQAILWPAYCPDEWLMPRQRNVAIGTVAEREAHAAAVAAADRRVEELKTTLAQAAEPLRAQLVNERLATLDSDLGQQLRAALDTAEGERSKEMKNLLKQHADAIEVTDEALVERFAQHKALAEKTAAEIAEAEAARPAPLEELSILTDVAPHAGPHHVLERGNYCALGDEASPGVLAALSLGGTSYEVLRQEATTASGPGTKRRTALARWLTSPEQPTVARITVNRIWQDHFGTGMVATPDNLGYTGAEPVHPELLDWLACEFREHGWSIKHLHRLIVTSSMFRQQGALADVAATSGEREAMNEDPLRATAPWLFSFPLRRLDAEQVRDAMLAVSGDLDSTMFGPYVPTERGGDGQVAVAEEKPGAHRRSLYLQQRRTQVLSLLDVFDAPSLVTNCVRRSSSTIPLQSLSLLNSEFIVARAKAFAARTAQDAGPTDEARVQHAFVLALGRGPHDEERTSALAFLASQPPRYDDVEDARARAWIDFCQMLLASNAFLYVE